MLLQYLWYVLVLVIQKQVIVVLELYLDYLVVDLDGRIMLR